MFERLTTTFTKVSPFKFSVWSLTAVRTRMRYHFPRPDERKRVVQHGYFARLATPNGRKILMRRILKGRHVLGH
ncbi:50S ribosomal protein L34 [Nasonia vitripennis]|uniref:Large ribosomal subunit protein bL34m n=1 Tax=Nasonia vitripennis TaxID=7425 RepID=A0A7M7QPD2_NASVI|nr:50S ribosomal protein L34 [Nasonia vitripennis]